MLAQAAQPSGAQPYAIFARAQAYWESAAYPKELSYGVTVSVWDRGKISSAHYHSAYDARTNQVFVTAVSDEELAHPYTPRGINFTINVLNGKTPISAPQHSFDYLGVPVLAPNYSFGMRIGSPSVQQRSDADLVQQVRREFHDPMPRGRKPQDTQLKTIATVTTVSRNYVIALSGIEVIDGHNDYHLLLRPVRDPQKYRLRDVWVDAVSFATDKLVTQGNFAYGGATDVPWTVSFKQIDRAPYIISESTKSAFSLVRHHYDAASVTFEEVRGASPPPFSNLRTFDVNPETGVPALLEP